MTPPTAKRAAGVPRDAALAWSQFALDWVGAEIQPSSNTPPADGTPAPRFPVRHDLNDIIRVIISDDVLPSELAVEVCVCVVSERLIPADDAARAAFDAAGPELRKECDEIGACRTGEAKMCDAHFLCCDRLVCTVGPRYVEKYRTAATNALSHCYRGALECCVESGMKTIAIPVVYSESKGFPREHAAHVATRTIRRFLENWPGKLNTVVFCLTKRDAELYVGGNGANNNTGTLAAYFPRTELELLNAEKTLPKDVGNKHGEMDIGERAIVISGFPSASVGGSGREDSSKDASNSDVEYSIHGNKKGFRRPHDEHDSASILGVVESPEARRARALRREANREAGNDDEFDFWFGDGGDEDDDVGGGKNGPDSPTARARSAAARHESMVRAAASVDLRSVAESGAVQVHGRDFIGRRVVSVDAVSMEHWLRQNRDRAEAERRILYHVAKIVAPAAADKKGCALVYFHGGGEKAEAPSIDFTRRLVDAALGNGSLEQNLKVFYVVHPTAWLQAGMLWGSLTGALSSGVFWKATFVHRLGDITGFIGEEQMAVPKHVTEFDDKLG